MRTIIFDFDGTIADSFKLAVDIFNELMKRDRAVTAKEVEALRGLPSREIIKKLGIPWYRLAYLAMRSRRIVHSRLDEVKPFLAIGPILHELHAQGHQLFVVSSNDSQNIDRFLTDHDMRQFFDKIYGNVGIFSKAKVLRKITREQSVGKLDCVYIGDEVRDVHAAQKVGMPVIAVTWGYNREKPLKDARPQLIVRKPQELIEACNSSF